MIYVFSCLPAGYLIRVVFALLYNTPSMLEYAVFRSSTVNLVSLIQLSKVLFAMLLTPLPMVTFVRLVQSPKALSSMLVTLLKLQ
jgi:hypothetical protein